MNKLIKYKSNLFNKIRVFFTMLFLKKENKNINKLYQKNDDKNFIDTIKHETDTETLRLLTLQDKFSNGEILEKDMTKEDIKALTKIYENQIENLKRKKANYKKKIFEIWKQNSNI